MIPDHICIFAKGRHFMAGPAAPDGWPNGAHITLSATRRGVVGDAPPAAVEAAARKALDIARRSIVWELRTDGLTRWVGTVLAPCTTTIATAVSEAERDAFTAAAAAKGQTLSAWLRDAGHARLGSE